MTKKIILFAVCLALCLSSVFVGVYNQANSANSAVDTAEAGGLIEGVAGATIPQAPEAKPGAILATADGYELTGNVTITEQAQLAGVQAALNEGKTFNGNGYTLTTTLSTPLFTNLSGGGTIENLVVDGDVSDNGEVFFGIFLGDHTSTADLNVTFDSVIVDATITVGAVNGWVSGFLAVASAPNASVLPEGVAAVAKASFINCAFTGEIKPALATADNYCAAGFVGQLNTAAEVTFENCTASGKMNLSCHMGGFVGNAYGSATFDNCYADVEFDGVNNVKASANGAAVGGYVAYVNNVSPKLIKISNSISEVTILDGAVNATRYLGGFLGGNYDKGNVLVENCVSNCEISIISGIDRATEYHIGGFVGGISRSGNAPVYKFVNCINETDINWSGINLYAKLGGFIGAVNNWGKNRYCTLTFENCTNNGDISVTNLSGNNFYAGGMVGFYGTAWNVNPLTVTDCVNNGNITITASSTETVSAAGLIAGSNNGLFAFDGFLNAGDITVTAASAKIAVAAAISGPVAGSGDKTAKDCVNLGKITANNAAGYESCVAGVTLTNCNSFALEATLETEATLTNGKGVVEVDMDAYNAIVATFGAENVEFGAIITLAKYVEKIGEFTHASFDAYLAENKATNAKLANIDSLYMVASLREGQSVEELVSITLEGATEGVEYVSRVYIKVGTTYIYSK